MIRYLAPPPRRPAGLVASVFDQMRHEFGVMAEALTLHWTIPELLVVTWACLRETVLARGRLPRAWKEAMALAISRTNTCPYCIDAHGMMLHALGRGDEERRLVSGEAPEEPRLGALADWAASTSRPRSVAPRFAAASPFAVDERPEAVGTVCCFQYINRLATVLLGDSPLPAPLSWFRSPAVRFVGRSLAPVAGRVPEPGEALDLVPAEIPRDPQRWDHLGWARGDARIAAAFAVFAHVTDSAAAAVLEPESREAVRAVMARRLGEEPSPQTSWKDSAWLDEALREVEEDRRPAVRLALRTALTPHRVTDEEVAAFRERHPGDPALLGLLCWSAHEAAREIARGLG